MQIQGKWEHLKGNDKKKRSGGGWLIRAMEQQKISGDFGVQIVDHPVNQAYVSCSLLVWSSQTGT